MRSRLFTLALSSALALGAAGAATAQDQPPPPPDGAMQGPPPSGQRHMDPNKQLQHLTRELDLSADQQSQIKPVLEDRDQQMQALFADQSLSQQDRRAKGRSITQASKSKIVAVLNDEQKQKFEAMQQQMRQGRHGGGNQAPPPPPDGGSSPQQ